MGEKLQAVVNSVYAHVLALGACSFLPLCLTYALLLKVKH
jgi:hypothetical protein